MPGSYSPQQLLVQAQSFAHNVPLTPVGEQLCDQVNSMIWCAFPWSWTQAAITAFNLVDGQQSYANVPTDFLRWVTPRIVRTDVTPDEYRELTPTSFLSPELSLTGGLETIQYIAYDPVSNMFRLDRAASVPSGTVLQIQGEYQKIPTQITGDNLNTVLDLPNRYSNVFVEGLKWKIYQYADDPRAGSVVIDRSGRRVYTGQLGVFHDALVEMQATEDVADAQATLHPESPLGAHRSSAPGLFGY